MDALFIGRKKSAGKSVRSPLFGTVVFDDDSKVIEFVEQHPTTRRANEVWINIACHKVLKEMKLISFSFPYCYIIHLKILCLSNVISQC